MTKPSSPSSNPADAETLLIQAGRAHGRNAVSVNPPVHRASTFLFDTMADFEEASTHPFDGAFYGRVGTPTTFAFEEAVCTLEGGLHAFIAVLEDRARCTGCPSRSRISSTWKEWRPPRIPG